MELAVKYGLKDRKKVGTILPHRDIDRSIPPGVSERSPTPEPDELVGNLDRPPLVGDLVEGCVEFRTPRAAGVDELRGTRDDVENDCPVCMPGGSGEVDSPRQLSLAEGFGPRITLPEAPRQKVLPRMTWHQV